MVRLVVALALCTAACGYEVSIQQGSLSGEPRFSAKCEELMPLRVGHAIEPPQVLQRVEPRPTGAKGIVIVATIVDTTGGICDAVVLRGLDDATDRAALDAVRQWRFKPAKLNGTPRAAVYNLTVKF